MEKFLSILLILIVFLQILEAVALINLLVRFLQKYLIYD